MVKLTVYNIQAILANVQFRNENGNKRIFNYTLIRRSSILSPLVRKKCYLRTLRDNNYYYYYYY